MGRRPVGSFCMVWPAKLLKNREETGFSGMGFLKMARGPLPLLPNRIIIKEKKDPPTAKGEHDMLINLIQSLADGRGVDWAQALAQVLSVGFVVLCVLPLHEFAHGWVAYKLGDPTAKNAGRLTLNPFKSLDPMGALAILLVGFGWAKPVPVNPRFFKNPKRGMAVTALAGPLSNLLAALVGAFLVTGLMAWTLSGGRALTGLSYFILQVLYYYVVVNISLAVFNLLPVPPLDGSRIVGMFLSDRALAAYYKNQQAMSFALMLLLVSGKLSGPLSTVQQAVAGAVFAVARFPLYLAGVL